MTTLTRGRKLRNRVPRVPVPLYVLSDSTGNLARHMVTSFLTQFPAGSFDVHTQSFVRESERLLSFLHSIRSRPGIVFHAVLSPGLKQHIATECKALNVPCCDLTGPSVDFLAKAAGLELMLQPQKLHPVDQAYCGRINAMAYTLEHDDGLGLDTLNAADIVLAGVSRTGKTPTSIYLAMQGYRVANVSLAIEAPIPSELLALAPGKTLGLIIDASHLAEIRGRRQTAWHMGQTQYSEFDHVQREIDWSRCVFKKLHCPVLDITEQAIEETAAHVLDTLNLTEPPQHEDGELS